MSWVKPVPQPAGTPYGKAGAMWSSGKHTGLDFPAPTGQAVVACAAGRVTEAGDTGGSYGIRVKVRHRAGLETWYCHLSSVAVRAGDQVAAGDVVGAVGATGNVTGPHLHLEVRVDGQHRDPAPYLSGAADAGSPTFPSHEATPAGALTGVAGEAFGVYRGLVLTGLFLAAGFGLVAVGAWRSAEPARAKAREKVGQAAQVAAAVYTGGASTAATATTKAASAATTTKGATR